MQCRSITSICAERFIETQVHETQEKHNPILMPRLIRSAAVLHINSKCICVPRSFPFVYYYFKNSVMTDLIVIQVIFINQFLNNCCIDLLLPNILI